MELCKIMRVFVTEMLFGPAKPRGYDRQKWENENHSLETRE